MTTIDEKMLREFRQDFKAAVLSLEKKYGISIEAKKISYSKDSFNLVVNASIIGKLLIGKPTAVCFYVMFGMGTNSSDRHGIAHTVLMLLDQSAV